MDRPTDVTFSPEPLYTCPLCSGDTEPMGFPELQMNNTMTEVIRCRECGSTFDEVYTFHGYRVINRGVGELADDGETKDTPSKLDMHSK